MLAQHGGREESHVSATTWREYARDNTTILKDVMKGILEEKLNIPLEVLLTINTILTIFSGLEALKEHKEKFAGLVVDASALIVTVWRAYIKSPTSNSESPSQYIERLNQTMIGIKKLLKMKIERNLVKRKLWILADLAKLMKYKERINSVAVGLEAQHNVNITQILREVMAEHRGSSQKNRRGADQSQTTKRSPSHTNKFETDECIGGKKGKPEKNTFTAEPESEDDCIQGTSRQATDKKTQRQRELRGRRVGSTKTRMPKDMAKPGTTSQPISETNSSSITGFTFNTNGGSVHNENVGIIFAD